MSGLRRLASIGGTSIVARAVEHPAIATTLGNDVAGQLGHLLDAKNGFYAFESALHVLSDVGGTDEKGLLEWNSEALWRNDYDGMADGAVFFAEDVFGNQFCVRDGGVATFEPETGAFELMAADLEEWAQKVLDDYELWTGHKVAHEWQALHGPIPVGARLVPITPFRARGKLLGRQCAGCRSGRRNEVSGIDRRTDSRPAGWHADHAACGRVTGVFFRWADGCVQVMSRREHVHRYRECHADISDGRRFAGGHRASREHAR